jgi:hypothetical protein
MTILLAADASGSHGLCPPGGQDTDGNVQVGSEVLILMKDGNMEDGGVNIALRALLKCEGKTLREGASLAYRSSVHKTVDADVFVIQIEYKDVTKPEYFFYVSAYVDVKTPIVPQLKQLSGMAASTEKSMLQLATICAVRLNCKILCDKKKESVLGSQQRPSEHN